MVDVRGDPVITEFIKRARDVTIAAAAKQLNLTFRPKGTEHPQPCPACGGTDRFSFNTAKNAWNCRGAEGGKDAIGMAAHVLELDLKRRDDFLEACAAVLGEEIPAGGERESDEDRQAREKRIADKHARAEADEVARQKQQLDFREAERAKARGIYLAAAALTTSSVPAGRFYLRARGAGVPDAPWLHVAAAVTYWHGVDELGRPAAVHSGPAMIARFMAPHAVPGEGWETIGCHITWIDLTRPPKFRPELVDPKTGELLPTKKMRGTKKGGLIPLAGSMLARRWVGGEGIENVLAVGRAERFRADTFYFAAGDLGNLAGPADPASAFPHPELTRTDRRGRVSPVMVQGPVPKPGSAGDAVPVPDHVDELMLVADGDSERVMTAAAMARARRRHHRPGRLIPLVWPRAGADFAQIMAEAE